ncbi:MAG: hypothetical protein KDA32_04665 [Phycisphaerales bacterium]|nr:hypothetical protein [Phycisphaerales bacterium]
MSRIALAFVFGFVALLSAQESPTPQSNKDAPSADQAKPGDAEKAADQKPGSAEKPEGEQTGAAKAGASDDSGESALEPRLPNDAQERVLQGLLRDQSRRPILRRDASTGQEIQTAQEGDKTLLLEGQMLVMRQGRLEVLSDRAEFHFLDAAEAGLEVIELLPNQTREFMERLFSSGVADFIVTGEVQRYRGKNYLLVRKADPFRGNGNLAP